MTTSRPSIRLRFSVLLSAGLILGLAGCSDSSDGQRSPVKNGVPVTSDSGLLTMTVPVSWSNETVACRDLIASPGILCEVAWVIDGTLSVDASSVILVSYEGFDIDTAEFVDQTFAAANDIYSGADSVRRSTFTTADGVTFERWT